MLYSKGTSCNCTIHWLTISQETLFEMPESQNDFCCNIRSVYYWPFTALDIFSY